MKKTKKNFLMFLLIRFFFPSNHHFDHDLRLHITIRLHIIRIRVKYPLLKNIV